MAAEKNIIIDTEKEYWLKKGYNEILIDFCRSNDIDILSCKLNKNNIKFTDPYFYSTLLHIACEENSCDMVKLILSIENSNDFVNVSDWNGDTALHIACYNGNLSIIKMLLDCNASVECVNKEGKIPLLESFESSLENPDIIFSEIFKLFYPKAIL